MSNAPTGEALYSLPKFGTSESDGLNGTYLSEEIHSLSGNDVVFALGGHDLINGGTGSDRLYGGSGNDTLIGGFGEDLLTGGSGADVFIFFPTRAAERDLIADFDANRDKILIKDVGGSTHADKFSQLVLHEVSDDLWIDVHGQAIILYNTEVTDVTQSHFIFEN